ncbi:MAG: hypothetical protein ACRESI_03580 [Gammaproteobacteria bacterium]
MNSTIVGELNDNQKRYVLSVLSEVNHYLENIEGLMHAKESLFRDLRDDIAPVERANLTIFMQTLRDKMLNIRDAFKLEHAHEAASARWGVSTNLEFASVELLELTKSKLAGYGFLDDRTFQDLLVQINGLRQMVGSQMEKFPPAKSGGGD